MRKMIGSMLGLVALAGMVGACGGATGEVGASAPATVTVAATVTAPAVTAPAVTAPAPAPADSASATMPDYVGQTLDVAEDELDSMGVTYHEVGGGAFGIVVKSNWEVCSTRPKSGKSIDVASDVALIVQRPGGC
jgi:hypothetical protein